MASIRSRNEKWQARVKRDGVTVEKSFLNRRDAEKWARLTEADIERGTFEPKPPTTAKSHGHLENMADLLIRFAEEVADQHRSPTTLVNLETLKRTIGDIALNELNAQVIARWRDQRLKTVQGASVVRELNTLSAVLNHARKEWCYAIVNPVADIKRPSSGKRRERRLNGGDESRLLGVLAPHYARVVQFALETAMRRGEILSLVWRNVDTVGRVALLPMTKNGEARRVPLSGKALEVLNKQREAQAAEKVREIDGRVFPVHHIALDKAWRAACTRGAIEGLHFHDLRHEAVSRLFERGLNVMEVAAISGHKTLAMLHRYTHLRAEDLAKKLL
jgi:integrase